MEKVKAYYKPDPTKEVEYLVTIRFVLQRSNSNHPVTVVFEWEDGRLDEAPVHHFRLSYEHPRGSSTSQ